VCKPGNSVSAYVSVTSTRGRFIYKIRIEPNDSSVFGEHWSNQERPSTGPPCAASARSRLRIALQLFGPFGGTAACNLTHRKWQPTPIDDLDQKESQRIAHFKAARSEHRAGLRLQNVVDTGSDNAAFHGYIVATIQPILKMAAGKEIQPVAGQAPGQRIEAAPAVAGTSCTSWQRSIDKPRLGA
jgi:hypothetical protein